MANHCRLAQATATAACNTIVDLVDSGGTGNIIIYTGAEPSYADDSAGTEVATCACAATAYNAASYDNSNKWSESDLASSAVDSSATGNASAVTYFRLVSGGAATVLQGTIGTSGADLNLNATTIGAGATVTITSLEVRVPLNQA